MHVIVIGAGPAGSLAAILLARRGAAVTLIEQTRFPRDKVCGECVSALGRSVLQCHDLEKPLLDAGAVELRTTCLRAGDHAAALPLPSPMLGVTRSLMDTHLLAAAVEAGVTVRQPARVESIVSDARSTSLIVRCLETNDRETIDADFVITADGRAALFGDRPAPTGDLGIKTHYVGVACEPHAITLFHAGHCYGGVAPVEGDRWNVAFSVPADVVKAAHGDVARVFADLLACSEPLRRAFESANRLMNWLAAPLPRYAVRRDWPPRVVPVGNAAAAIEPIGGEGMGLALASAEAAVEAILTGELDSLPARYHQLWNRRARFCRWSAQLLSAPAVAPASVELLGRSTLKSLPLLKLIGK